MQVLVARVGKAHGLRGEVTVQLHTDIPDRRLAVGAVLVTDPPAAGPVRVRGARLHNGVQLVSLDGVTDRNGAERLRGVRLFADVPDQADDSDPAGDSDAAAVTDTPDEGWYPEQLAGMRVERPGGQLLGTVTGLEPRPAQDLLIVVLLDGREALVPFVHALVPVVDVAGGRVVVDAPPGLLDLDTEG